MPPEIKRLADQFLSNPVRVEASKPATAATTISQYIVPSGREPVDKRAVLRALIKGADNFKNAIIFCNRKRDVATLHRSLSKHGFSVGALHGDMDQRARTATLDDFRRDRIKLLVASDVAARGLDIPAVSHIFNFDVPTHAEDYIHRIGRTGRAGLTGTSITIATSLDRKYVAGIERLTGHPIPPLEVDAEAERAAALHKGRAERTHSAEAHKAEPHRAEAHKAEAEAPAAEAEARPSRSRRRKTSRAAARMNPIAARTSRSSVPSRGTVTRSRASRAATSALAAASATTSATMHRSSVSATMCRPSFCARPRCRASRPPKPRR